MRNLAKTLNVATSDDATPHSDTLSTKLSPMPRPDAPPRPVCRYYNTTPRGCFAGAKCHFLHGDPAVQKYAPYEENKRCRFFDAGYCKRGKECWFRHVDPLGANKTKDGDGGGASESISLREGTLCENEEDMSCGICFEEKPALYGLLSGCSHAFCLSCIRRWRDPGGKDDDMTDSGIHKTCPMCRLRTKFIVPSSRFYPQGDPQKAEVVNRYKQSMARVPCRYFVRSKPSNRFCPFGRDCFYQHANPDGSRYEFAEGVDVMMTRWLHRRTGNHPSSHHTDPIQAALEVLEGFAETLAAGDGTEDSGTRRAMIDMHVRDMLRIMGAAPALRTLAQLEQMAGPDQDEPQASSSGEVLESVEAASAEEADVPQSITPTPSSPSPRSAPVPRHNTSSSSSSSSSSSTTAAAAAYNSPYESQDPRSPQNTSHATQLTSADFAWRVNRAGRMFFSRT